MAKIRRNSIPAALAAGVFISIAATVVLCLVNTVLFYRQILPMTMVHVLADAAACCGALIGSAAAIRIRRRQALPVAAATALGLFMLSCILSLLSGGEHGPGQWLVDLGVSVFAGAFLGAVMSLCQNRRKRHGKR